MALKTYLAKIVDEDRGFPLAGLVLLFVVAVLPVFVNVVTPPPTALSVVLRFAQLTDPHIFDAAKSRGGKPPDKKELEDTKETFNWALHKLSERMDLDFVVITGDFGLEMVSPFFEKPAAQYVAQKLESLGINTILLVPGNNDLLDEDFRDFNRYERFVHEVRDLLALKGKTVLDLTKRSPVINGVRILGLESSTFKNSKCKSSPDGCKEAYKYQLEKMKWVRDELTKDRKPGIIFTHIPDLYDPFTFELSWSLRKDARVLWETSIANNNDLKAIFSGHFHSQNENDYEEPAHLNPWYNARNVQPRFIVSPPLAGKFQDAPKKRIQGFLIGTVDTQGRVSYKKTIRKSGFWCNC